jgi:exodeoxyribonuclease V gamma subunit
MPFGLPPRIVVFGISNLPMQVVEALAALGRWCQVVLMVQNPCQEYWGHDMDLVAQKHSLLASWGQQGRDYLHALERFDQPQNALALMTKQSFFVDPLDADAPTRLQHVQSDILNLNAMPEVPESLADDGSIQMVQAHSAQREVEILHDQLWDWFDHNPAWKPTDVMVMVPDMATFASHIQAVFGRFPPQHPRHIPFSVADTTPRQVPLIQALEFLLNLPDARMTLSEWLGLFEVKMYKFSKTGCRRLPCAGAWILRTVKNGVFPATCGTHSKIHGPMACKDCSWGMPPVPPVLLIPQVRLRAMGLGKVCCPCRKWRAWVRKRWVIWQTGSMPSPQVLRN